MTDELPSLSDLRERIAAKREGLAEKPSNPELKDGGMAEGVYFCIDLLAGLAVGGGIGWWIDNHFGTKPFGMAICLIFGGAAGFLTVYRMGVAKDREKKAENAHETLDNKN